MINSRHPKSVRRRLLMVLYENYLKDPLNLLTPEDLLADGTIAREDLAANAFYLHDHALIKLMIGYNPPMFAAAHITAKGIDLVENHYELNLLFPAVPGADEEDTAELPVLVERLVEEADFSPLDGEARMSLLRDVQYLRDELARPVARWRTQVLASVLDWIGGHFEDPGAYLPSLGKIRGILGDKLS